MSFHVPNQYRLRTHAVLGSDDSAGNNGCFFVPSCVKHWSLAVIATVEEHARGRKWEHASVHAFKRDRTIRIPIWMEMSLVKDLFWDAEDTVIQYHPPKSEYINIHEYVLHMWRPEDRGVDHPDTWGEGRY